MYRPPASQRNRYDGYRRLGAAILLRAAQDWHDPKHRDEVENWLLFDPLAEAILAAMGVDRDVDDLVDILRAQETAYTRQASEEALKVEGLERAARLANSCREGADIMGMASPGSFRRACKQRGLPIPGE